VRPYLVRFRGHLTLLVITALATGLLSTYVHSPSTPVPLGNWGLKYNDIVYGVFYPRFLEVSYSGGRYWYSPVPLGDLARGEAPCPAPYVDYFLEYPPVVGALWYASTCVALTLASRGDGAGYAELISAVAEVHFLVNAVVLVTSMILTSILIYKALEGSPGLRGFDRALLYLALPSVILYTTYNWDSLCSLLALSSLVALSKGRGRWRFLVAGLLLGLSVATKLLTASIALVLLVHLVKLRRSGYGRSCAHFLAGLLAGGGIPYLVLLVASPRALLDFLGYHSTWYCENCIYSTVIHDIFSPLHRFIAAGTVLAFTVAVALATPRRRLEEAPERVYGAALCAVGGAVVLNYVSTPQMLLLVTPLALVALSGADLTLYVLSDALNALIMVAFFSDASIREVLSSLGLPVEVRFSPWTPDSPIQWLAYARSALLIVILVRRLRRLYIN